MIYHALFIVNHVPHGLLVEAAGDKPNPAVLRVAELAAEFTDYSKLRVLRDAGNFFAPQHTGGPYPELALMRWVDRGRSVFDWAKLLKREAF